MREEVVKDILDLAEIYVGGAYETCLDYIACAALGDGSACIHSEPETEASTNAPTDSVTEPATEAPSNAPTDIPTDATSEVPTDAPTDAPSEAPSKAPANQRAAAKRRVGQAASAPYGDTSGGGLHLAVVYLWRVEI